MNGKKSLLAAGILSLSLIMSGCGLVDILEKKVREEFLPESTPIPTATPTPTPKPNYLPTPSPVPTETPQMEETDFPESRVGYYSNGYWAMDLKAVDNHTGTVTYDGYEYRVSRYDPVARDKTGKILDSNTLLIEGGVIPWTNETTFYIENASDAMFMSDMQGEASSHDIAHGAGTYQISKRPSREEEMLTPTPTPAAEDISYLAGTYTNRSQSGVCTLTISNVSGRNFDFEISREGQGVIFAKNTATGAGGQDKTAVFQGNQYQLKFLYSDGLVMVMGFDELGESNAFFKSDSGVTADSQQTGVKSGEYRGSSWSNGSGINHSVNIYEVTAGSFKFNVKENGQLIFMDNTAELSGTSGIYRGHEYTLNFTFNTAENSVKVSGYSVIEGETFTLAS